MAMAEKMCDYIFMIHKSKKVLDGPLSEIKAGQEKGLTVVPLSLYFAGGYAKVEIGVGRGKREYDKRQTLAERDARREAERAIRRRR